MTALAKILDVPESLLELGRRIVPPPAGATAASLFLREAPAGAPPPMTEMSAAPRVAEIDDLFTGG